MMPKVPPPQIGMIKVRHFWPYRLGSEGRGYYENRDEEGGKGRREGLLREAYSGLGEEECENKVRKRLRLLEGGEEGVVPGGVS